MSIPLLLPLIALFIGLALLVWSSDIFIDGAASTALHLNVSPLIIGVVVLGFGTSMPEIIVSTLAALEGNPGLAIGNAIGSNIANIALVLGATVLIAPIVVKSSLLKREFPILLAVTVIGFALLADNKLNQTDGYILISMLILTMIWMIKANQNAHTNDPIQQETLDEIAELPQLSRNKALSFIAIGLIILMSSAKLMVWGAVEIAHYFAVPDVIIGLTIVAIGTSLPELASAIAAARKNEADLMIGNIIGSNLFNLLAVMAMPAIISPSILSPEILTYDYSVMLGLTFAMLLVALPRKGKATITRVHGVLFLACFVFYMVSLYFRSV